MKTSALIISIVIILLSLSIFYFFHPTKFKEPPLHILEDIKKQLLYEELDNIWNEKAFGDSTIVYLGSEQISDNEWNSIFEMVVKGDVKKEALCFESIKLVYYINASGYNPLNDTDRSIFYITTSDFYNLKVNESGYLNITRDYECLEVKQPQCKILYDNSHSQYNTDYIDPYVHRELLKRNCKVEILWGNRVDIGTLTNTDIYIVGNIPQRDFENEEINIIKNYVEDGGILIEYFDGLNLAGIEVYNSLIKPFGAEFVDEMRRGNVTAIKKWGIIPNPIFKQDLVDVYFMPINLTSENSDILLQMDSYPVFVIINYGKGKVVITTASHMMAIDFTALKQQKDGKIEDSSVLYLEMLKWLLENK